MDELGRINDLEQYPSDEMRMPGGPGDFGGHDGPPGGGPDGPPPGGGPGGGPGGPMGGGYHRYMSGAAFPREESEKLNWRDPLPEIPESSIAETYEADVIVVGGGQSGLCAARAAAEAGASVIVLERMPEELHTLEGGGQIGHINSKLLGTRGIPEVDIIEFVNDWQLRSNNRSNAGLIMKFAKNSGDCLDWFIEPLSDEERKQISIRCHTVGGPYCASASGIRTWVGTAELGRNLQTKAMHASVELTKSMGGRWFYGLDGRRLLMDGGVVRGLLAIDEAGKYYRFLCGKAIILATGDFLSNNQMCKELLTEIYDQHDGNIPSSGMGCDGSGVRMGLWAGGRIETRPISTMGGSYVYPSESPNSPVTTAPVLWLNEHGKRYCNEGFGDAVLAGIHGKRQPKGKLTAVFDNKIIENGAVYPRGHLAVDFDDPKESSRLRAKLDKAAAAGEAGVRAGGITLYASGSIEELARLVGYTGRDADDFTASVHRYNELCISGIDTDFAKDAKFMLPIENPPFYAYAGKNTGCFIMAVTGGLMIDADQNVLDSEYEPIPGLLATGNTSGCRFGLQYTTPVAGISIGIAQTLGREAGRAAAAMPSRTISNSMSIS